MFKTLCFAENVHNCLLKSSKKFNRSLKLSNQACKQAFYEGIDYKMYGQLHKETHQIIV